MLSTLLISSGLASDKVEESIFPSCSRDDSYNEDGYESLIYVDSWMEDKNVGILECPRGIY